MSAGGRRGSSSHEDHGRGSPARRGGERAERSHGRGTPRAENPREGAPRDGSRAESSPQGAARGSGRGKSGREGARGGARTGGDQADRRKSFSRSAPSERRRTADPARLAAFDVLREVDGSDAYANLVLPPMLRARKIAGRDAAFATELAYGTLRLRGRYDAVLEQCSQRPLGEIDAAVLDILRLGCHQLLGMRVAPHAAVSETVGLARLRTGAGSGQFVNAVLRRVSERPLEEWLDLVAAAADPAGDAEEERLAVVASHPAWVVRALRGALVANGRDPGELAALLEADNTAPRVTLVARPGLATADDVPERATPGAWAPTAFTIEGGDPGALRSVREGRVGVQDEGSQLVALALAAAPLDGPDEAWLDLCAGPGGKAALLGAIAAQRGARLVANEVAEHRARLVRRAVEAVPGGVVEVRHGDGRDVGQHEPGAYDRVLVDAPCTGLGALRRRPESRWRRRPSDLAGLGPLQRELLASALDAVRPGGVVAYVTCSPHVAETHLVVEDVVRGRTDVEIVDVRDVVRAVVAGPSGVPARGSSPSGQPSAGEAHEDSAHTVPPREIELADRPDVQLWPHVHGTDAMFLALLRKR